MWKMGLVFVVCLITFGVGINSSDADLRNVNGVASINTLSLNSIINLGAGNDNTLPNTMALYGFNAGQSGTCTNTGVCHLYFLNVSDQVDSSAASNGETVFDFRDDIGSQAKGGRYAFSVLLNEFATPHDCSCNIAKVALFAEAKGSATSETGTTGGLWSFNTITQDISSGYVQLHSEEHDIDCHSACNPSYIDGVEVSLATNHTTGGSLENAGFLVTAGGGTATMDTAFLVGGYQGTNPMASGGWIMRYMNHAYAGGIGATIAGGIDFTHLTFTDSAFKSTGFTIDGSGNVTSPSYETSTALITAVNGGNTAAFTANMVGSTGGPTAAAQNGWLKMKDSSGATIWVPVWK